MSSLKHCGEIAFHRLTSRASNEGDTRRQPPVSNPFDKTDCSIEVSLVVCLRGNCWSPYEPPRNSALRTPMEPNFGIPDSRFTREQVRWRPWPCLKCAAGATPVGFLAASHRTNPEIPNRASSLPINERIEHLARFERDQLSSWCEGCEHSGGVRQDDFFRIAEGSEHIVYKETGDNEGLTEVVKVTHPRLCGDNYAVTGRKFRNLPALSPFAPESLQRVKNSIESSNAPVLVA